MKLENILLDLEGHIILTDFGLSALLPRKDALTKGFFGTTVYMAPEICKSQNYGLAVDWWSVGVLCVEMLTGTLPFVRNSNENSVVELQRIMEEDPDIGDQIQGDVRDFVVKLLEKDPAKRLGNKKGAIELKGHPFFKNMNWEDLSNRRVNQWIIKDSSRYSDNLPKMHKKKCRII